MNGAPDRRSDGAAFAASVWRRVARAARRWVGDGFRTSRRAATDPLRAAALLGFDGHTARLQPRALQRSRLVAPLGPVLKPALTDARDARRIGSSWWRASACSTRGPVTYRRARHARDAPPVGCREGGTVARSPLRRPLQRAVARTPGRHVQSPRFWAGGCATRGGKGSQDELARRTERSAEADGSRKRRTHAFRRALSPAGQCRGGKGARQRGLGAPPHPTGPSHHLERGAAQGSAGMSEKG